MTLTVYANIIRQCLTIHHRGGEPSPSLWYALFEHGEVIDGPMLRGTFGNGATPAEALANYVKEIRGKTMVFDAMNSEKRREYNVPMELEP